MAFFQDPPRPAHAWDGDPLLRECFERQVPEASAADVEELRELGALSSGALYDQQLEERLVEPRHVPFDPWGRRVDRIEHTPLWRRAAELAAVHGLVAVPHERRLGPASRVHWLALLHVLEPSLDVYSCPLAMSDGAVRTLLDSGNQALASRAVPRLTARDPARAWTSGQWMTERTGGSDVGLSETVARNTGDGWRLYGTKWFCSATSSEMALTLARPEGNGPGGKGLALFYLETRDASGAPNALTVMRLKEKLGTRKLPTGEVELHGAAAEPVSGLDGGVRAIAPMLSVTRLWNAVSAVAGMHRALSLARDYARRRFAFGARLAAKPLHVDTLAGLEAEREGAFLLAARAAELLGRAEAGVASEAELLALRSVVPIAKATTGKQAVAIASEALECFGGAGYIEDTGLPRLLRDAQVLPIWEGTTNVLSLDLLRALATPGGAAALRAEIRSHLGAVRAAELREAAEVAARAAEHLDAWVAEAGRDPRAAEAGARRHALSAGRTLELALLCAHAQWCLDNGHGGRAAAAARRLARHGVDLLDGASSSDAALLVDDAG
ncbi:MAG TPA: acyl-CoA dehydrogenase family protein [Anaeromyxobacteraceae bacterium]|nr:acyl-CoA dehydrogenase family protein [Anaeromyxobacteraceae bacterium]